MLDAHEIMLLILVGIAVLGILFVLYTARK